MEAPSAQPLEVIELGLLSYREAWDLQIKLHSQIADGIRPDTLLLLEHPHVFTLGRRGRMDDILIDQAELDRLGIDVYQTDRGGEVTYHGPGQLVGYPLIELRRRGVRPLKYVRALEQVLVDTLDEFGISATSEGHPTGVWVDDRKIAAIGVKVGRRVTTHGFALNVSTDLSFFKHIVPCGMPMAPITSINQETGNSIVADNVAVVLVQKFASEFGFSPELLQVSYNSKEIVSAAD